MRVEIKTQRILGILGFFAAAFSDAAIPTKLAEWIELSWKYSPEVRASSAQVEASEAVVLSATSTFMPSLFARYQFRENEQSAQTKVLSLNAEQNLFRGFSDFHTRSEAVKLNEAQEHALNLKKMTLAKNVGDSLLKIAATTSQKAILAENSRILDERLKEFKRRTRIGRSRDVDLLQNQIDRIQLERLIANNKRNYLTALATLKEYTGVDVNASPFEMEKLLRELNAFHEQLRKVSPRREELKARLEAQESAVSASYGSYLPTLKGVASYYPENDSSFSRYADDWSIGIDAEWRFFEGFATKAEVSQERALRILAEAELQKFEYDDVETLQRLRDEWTQLITERNLVNEAEKLSVKSFKAQERDFRLGLITALELNNSDEQYLDLKLEKITIQEKLGLILTQAIERGGIEGLKL